MVGKTQIPTEAGLDQKEGLFFGEICLILHPPSHSEWGIHSCQGVALHVTHCHSFIRVVVVPRVVDLPVRDPS